MKTEDRMPFLCAPALRIESQERLAALEFRQLHAHLGRIEAGLERLERRLWLTVFGVVGVILAQAVQSLIVVGP